jgi:hypothetical protein
LALAKVIDLTTTLLFGRQMQPEQDWLPMSIPQTYLMLASSAEESGPVSFIAHLLFLLGNVPVSATSGGLSLGSARNPANQGERQLILDWQSSPCGS